MVYPPGLLHGQSPPLRLCAPHAALRQQNVRGDSSPSRGSQDTFISFIALREVFLDNQKGAGFSTPRLSGADDRTCAFSAPLVLVKHPPMCHFDFRPVRT